MIRIKKVGALLLVLILSFMCTFTVAFADPGDDNTNPAEAGIGDAGEKINSEQADWLKGSIIAANKNGITAKETWMKNWLTTDPDAAEEQSPLFIYGESTNIYLKKGKSQEDLSKQVATSYKSSKTVEDVSNITNGLNISADTEGAAAMMQGFSPIISLLLGIMVTLITIGMTIFSAFDIAYIAFPVFRNKCEDAKGGSGGSNAMVKKESNGDSSLRFVTDDAQYAVSQGTIENGRSPWAIYFKKRVMSYILLAIILFILLTGNISLLTNIALKVVSGIMNILGGLA